MQRYVQVTIIKRLFLVTYLLTYLRTLMLAYLYCVFAFRSHLKCAVRTYDLNYVEKGKIHEYSYEMGSASALTYQIVILFLLLLFLKCVNSVKETARLVSNLFY